MSTEIGNLNGGTRQQISRSYRTDGTKTIEYVLASTDETAFLGSYNVGTSVDDGLVLESIEIQNNKGVTRATLRFVTEEELINISYGGTGNSKASDANGAQIPLRQHPNYPNMSAAIKEDVEAYIQPQPIYTYTSIVNTFSFTESNVVDGVGELSAPTGMTSPTANCWLKMSKTVSPVGSKYRITETWQHRGIVNGTAMTWEQPIYGTE
jgi:hypothetical protein